MSSRDAQEWIRGKHPRRLRVCMSEREQLIRLSCVIPFRGIGWDWMHIEWFTRPNWRSHAAATIRRSYKAVKELPIVTKPQIRAPKAYVRAAAADPTLTHTQDPSQPSTAQE